LLQAEKLSLGGARCEVTVFFADVRGFTTFTDETQERVAEFIRMHQLDSEAAEKCYDESARETLETVNLYLATVADAVKNHGGTLDKYIGDCVMAFWNAPVAHATHALTCVRAAIEAQRAIHELNQKRLAQNTSRDIENRARLSAGLPPKPLLTALQLGTGINTGLVTVGLMGSDAHILNYTIFGREVNLASRLEGVSGSGRIIISDMTHNHLLRHDPALAASCVELPSVTVKGIKAAVRIFEVPWQNK
jgi:adenylate cyclase